jgi:hypothetical protein
VRALLFFASFFAPLLLEHWCHRRRAGAVARWAFVPVGARRLSSALEAVERDATGYRSAKNERIVPRLPAGEWSLSQDDDGRVDVRVSSDGTHAVVRVNVPWRRRGSAVARPTRVIATVRLNCERDGDGLILRARALPTWLAFWWAAPFFVAGVLAERSESAWSPILIVAGGLVLVSVAQIIPQAMWWGINGRALFRAADSALEVVATKLEASLEPRPVLVPLPLAVKAR